MQNNNTIKYRLAEFLKHLGIGQAKFAQIIGVSKGFANNVGDSIRTDNLNKIAEHYPELNITWLLTGEGEMLKGGTQGEAGGVTIPASVWNVIEKQAESLAARDRQLEMLMKSRDEQINQLISTVRREIADLKKTYVHTEAATFADAG